MFRLYFLYFSAKLEQQTLGDGHMHIKGVETGPYIAMNSKGKLYSSVSHEFIPTHSEEKRKTLFTENLFAGTFTSKQKKKNRKLKILI